MTFPSVLNTDTLNLSIFEDEFDSFDALSTDFEIFDSTSMTTTESWDSLDFTQTNEPSPLSIQNAYKLEEKDNNTNTSPTARVKRNWTRYYGDENIPISTRKLMSILHKMEKEPAAEMKLYSFLSHQHVKHDSLAHFSNHLARLVTSGNLHQLQKLVRRHCQRSCIVGFECAHMSTRASTSAHIDLSLKQALHLFALTRDLHPDGLLRVLTSTIVGQHQHHQQQIHAQLEYTYTNTPALHSIAQRIATDPMLKRCLRNLHSRQYVQARVSDVLATLPLGVKRDQLYTLVTSHGDWNMVYMVNLTLTYNASRKITRMDYACTVKEVANAVTNIQF